MKRLAKNLYKLLPLKTLPAFTLCMTIALGMPPSVYAETKRPTTGISQKRAILTAPYGQHGGRSLMARMRILRSS